MCAMRSVILCTDLPAAPVNVGHSLRVLSISNFDATSRSLPLPRMPRTFTSSPLAQIRLDLPQFRFPSGEREFVSMHHDSYLRLRMVKRSWLPLRLV